MRDRTQVPSEERKDTGMKGDARHMLLSPLIADCEIGKQLVQGGSAHPDPQDTSHIQDCPLPGASPSRPECLLLSPAAAGSPPHQCSQALKGLLIGCSLLPTGPSRISRSTRHEGTQGAPGKQGHFCFLLPAPLWDSWFL